MIPDNQNQIQVDIDTAKNQVALRDALRRLSKNRDFKKLVLEQYFEKEPVRLCMLRADHNFQDPKDQADLLKELDAIGCLQQFFRSVLILGDRAEGALAEYEEELAEMRAEEE